MNQSTLGTLKQSIYSLVFGLFFLTASQLTSGPLHTRELRGEYKAPFSGLPLRSILQPSATVNCFSDNAATTGYYREIGTEEVSLQSSGIKSQMTGGGYKISIEDRTALVFDQFLKRSEHFQVVTRTSKGVILVQNRGDGVSVITIDPLNGSFVLSDSVVHSVSNRTNVWVGRCTS